MTMSLWEPMRELITVRDMMERLLEESFVPARQR